MQAYFFCPKTSEKPTIPLNEIPESHHFFYESMFAKTEQHRFANGAIVGVVEVVEYQLITSEYIQTLSAREIAFGDYSMGGKRQRWAWVTTNSILFDEPITYTGHQGIRDFDLSKVG